MRKRSLLSRCPTYFPSLLFSGYHASCLGMKWGGGEVNHLALPTAEVKNEWRYSSTTSVCIHGHGQGRLYLFFTHLLRTLYEHFGLGRRTMIKWTLKKQGIKIQNENGSGSVSQKKKNVQTVTNIIMIVIRKYEILTGSNDEDTSDSLCQKIPFEVLKLKTAQ